MGVSNVTSDRSSTVKAELANERGGLMASISQFRHWPPLWHDGRGASSAFRVLPSDIRSLLGGLIGKRHTLTFSSHCFVAWSKSLISSLSSATVHFY